MVKRDIIPPISESEWEVMRVIWSHKEITSGEVIAALAHEMEWSASTIKTLLARLVSKGLLQTRREGNRFHYSPLVSERAAWRAASSQLIESICAQKMGQKIALLIEQVPLSFADLELLQESIDKKRASALPVVPCDCIPDQCLCESCQEVAPRTLTAMP